MDKSNKEVDFIEKMLIGVRDHWAKAPCKACAQGPHAEE